MRTFAAVILLGLVAAVPARATINLPVPAPVTQASVVKAPELTSKTLKYAVYTGDGRKHGTATWRVTPAGQNCCEVYVSSTPSGRLLTFGGTFPFYSDDQGRTWYRVQPVTPLNNGEGAIIAGPNGTAYGVGWDAYSGDHLQGVRYTPGPGGGTWEVSELPVHTPFFDRPWITYAKFGSGFGTLISGGGTGEDPALFSTDGLSYSDVTSMGADEMSSAPVHTPSFAVAANPDADWTQGHPWPGTLPLSGGGLFKLDVNDFTSCTISQFDPAGDAWHCADFTAPGFADGPFCCQLRQDSRGWLSDVRAIDRDGDGSLDAIDYQLSTDGGRTWSAPLVLKPPVGTTLETSNFYNVVANGKLGLAAVQARFDDAQAKGHDMVFRVDISRAQPRLRDVLVVGKGDIITANDVSGSTGDRFDYPSVTIMPSGAIAMSFDDSTTRELPETTYTQARKARDQLTNPDAHSPNLAIQILK